MTDFTQTEFYKKMTDELMSRELSIREFAKVIGMSYASLIEFFNKDRNFRPVGLKNMARIHNNVGISYDVIKDYNAVVKESRQNKKEG